MVLAERYSLLVKVVLPLSSAGTGGNIEVSNTNVSPSRVALPSMAIGLSLLSKYNNTLTPSSNPPSIVVMVPTMVSCATAPSHIVGKIAVCISTSVGSYQVWVKLPKSP